MFNRRTVKKLEKQIEFLQRQAANYRNEAAEKNAIISRYEHLKERNQATIKKQKELLTWSINNPPAFKTGTTTSQGTIIKTKILDPEFNLFDTALHIIKIALSNKEDREKILEERDKKTTRQYIYKIDVNYTLDNKLIPVKFVEMTEAELQEKLT